MSDMALLAPASALVAVIAALAMPAGNGGGILYVPLLQLVGITASPSASAALSQPVVVGASLAGSGFNLVWQLRHPEKRLVEPRLALATIAPTLSGVTIGTLLNTALPELAILVMLVLTIAWNLHSSFKKAVALWRKESAAKAATQEKPAGGPPPAKEPDLAKILEQAVRQTTTATTTTTTTASADPEVGRAGSAAPVSSASPAPVVSESVDWLKLFGLFAVVIAAMALRGGRSGPSLFEVCSPPYWGITAAVAIVLLGAGWYLRHPDIAMWKCFAVGVLSAVVGIGGGLIFTPMLLALGVEATKSAATTTVLVLMVTSSASFMFVTGGQIPMLPMAVLSAAAFCGSLLGKAVVGWLVAKTGRTSILVFLLAGILGISGSVVTVQGAAGIFGANARGDHSFLDFHDVCAA
mmetsp:Transcript_42109/g.119120  ORF Transcript_42109/g.119120 Transcript_42109/m.119120 type:complete len:410 (-) Transcript_42109:13-1242(-)